MKGKQKGEPRGVAENANMGENFVMFPTVDKELHNFF
jgi:hypothetical protein